MITATVKYIANGYTVMSPGTMAMPAYLFAGSVPEVVYWLGKLFDPYGTAVTTAPTITPRIIVDDDPLMNQMAEVQDMASGGFLVRQLGMQPIETYCPSMDQVADTLTAIFTPPEPEPINAQ